MRDLGSFKVPCGFRGASAAKVQLWWIVQASVFRWTPQFAYEVRAVILRLFGAKVGKNSRIRPSVQITYPWKVSLGDNVWLGDDVVLYSLGPIDIGDNSVISQKSYLCGGDHDMSAADFPIRSAPIKIGSRVWLATDVFVAPGVEVVDDVVVGARSSVFRNIHRSGVYVGTPAVFRRAIES